MNENLIISGLGVIGTEALHGIVKRNKSKKLKIFIIEKDYSNFPGGVAYSTSKSKYGFFNNPLRLSNEEFKDWVKNVSNQKRLIHYFRENKDLKLKKWLEKNVAKNNYKFKNLRELYLPRSAYSVFLRDKIKNTFKILKKKKSINIYFFENELLKIKKKNKEYLCHTKTNLKEKNIFLVGDKLKIKNKKERKLDFLKSSRIILGLGILPPANINFKKSFSNTNYIHDFYASGGTKNLINKLDKINSNQKKINLVFIGSKAGLLETMQEIENLNNKILSKLKMISVSSSSLSLEKAELSNNYKNYKFQFLNNEKLKKITKSNEILSLIIAEFKNGKKKGFNKYDVWTLILQKNLLDKCFKKLSDEEKKEYNNKTFTQLRGLTRYTYPETVESKIRLEKKKILKYLKDKVIELKKDGDKITVKTEKSGNLLADIVINVSGPVSLFNNHNEVLYLDSLKRICTNFNERGFVSDKYHRISSGIYLPGTLSSNFNPERKTIIKSITENTKMVVKHLIK